MHRVFYARLAAVLCGLTYFGWAWVLLGLLWMLVYGTPPATGVTEWQAIEGEVYVYAVALLLPAIGLSLLSVGVLLSPRPWLMKLLAILAGCQIPLILHVTWWEMGFAETRLAVMAVVGCAGAAIWSAFGWHRSVGTPNSGLGRGRSRQ